MTFADKFTRGFDKLRRAATRAADSFRRLGTAMQRLKPKDDIDAFNPNSADPEVVKALIPRSHFTKRGPGVRASAAEAFRRMTSEQRATARRMGWLR